MHILHPGGQALGLLWSSSIAGTALTLDLNLRFRSISFSATNFYMHAVTLYIFLHGCICGYYIPIVDTYSTTCTHIYISGTFVETSNNIWFLKMAWVPHVLST